MATRPTRSARIPIPTLTPRRLALLLLVAVPMVFNAVALWPEVAIPIPNVNDDAEHAAFVRRASDALATGENLIDHWLPELDLGFPEFFYYQHAPHLAVVVLHRALFEVVDLFVLFNFVRWALLVALPLTVFWSMRRMESGDLAAGVGAAASSVLSAGHLYGFEYDSYVWRGFGLYTQLWAMHLSFVALACLYRLLRHGSGTMLAIVALGSLALSHLIYAYMMAISALVLLPFTLRRGRIVAALVPLAVAGAAALAISSYLWLPFLGQLSYLSASPNLQPDKYASYGAPTVLGWLVSGRLFDHDRLPVLTALLIAGTIAAVAARRRLGLLSLSLLAVWLWFYSGRSAIGPLFDYLPLHDGLLLHRFIGGVHLAGILLIGLGGASIWGLISKLPAPTGVARAPGWRNMVGTVAIVVLLTPALAERSGYYGQQSAWIAQTHDAIANDEDLRTILGSLRRRPAGRVYAGLASNWGRTLDFGLPFNSAHVYQLLTAEGFPTVAPPFGGQSLNSDLQFEFDEQRAGHYDLFNVRYVIASPAAALPSFLVPLAVTRRYVLYEAPTSGYGELVGLSGSERVPSQAVLFGKMREFVNGPGPDSHLFMRYDFPPPAIAAAWGPVARCVNGAALANERLQAARLSFDAACGTATPMIVKVTYHPGWVVTIDGVETHTFMASPSYLGFMLPPGSHVVVAEYRSAPVKAPLLALGGVTLLAASVLWRRGILR